jgi:hypothetical protein
MEPSENYKYIILGAIFFDKYCTVFDYEKKEIKFAKAKQPPIPDEQLQPGKTWRNQLTY